MKYDAEFANPSRDHGDRHIPQPAGGAQKRIFDVILAGVAIICLLPLMIAIALLVRLADRGPILHLERRRSPGGEAFDCYSFRKLPVDWRLRLGQHLSRHPDELASWIMTETLKDDILLTPVGRVLHRTGLDDLPQLLNVLFGDMSFVGPPSLPVDRGYVKRGNVSAQFCRPGMISDCRATADGVRNGEMAAASYAAQWSFLGDLKILVRAIGGLFQAERFQLDH
ncbi:sugar transferase [Rhizobium mongolense]|uniref:sugar transferase n=1 Tax=Rhizobium mongolense TaxID=57676 RepID=UPI00355686FF